MTFIQSGVRISCVGMTFSMVTQYTAPVSDGTDFERHKSDVPEYTKATTEYSWTDCAANRCVFTGVESGITVLSHQCRI